MDWLQFTSEMMSSIAWPMTTLVILLVYKNELIKIVRRLAKLKYNNLELEFAKLAQDAEAVKALEPAAPIVATANKELREIHNSPDGNEQKVSVISTLEEQIEEAIEQSPLAAILLAWSGLETALAKAVTRLAISPDPPSYRSSKHNIDMLGIHFGFSSDSLAMLHDLRNMRNTIAHDQEIMTSVTSKMARTYSSIAIDFTHILDQIQK